ncbi:type III-B CRISPR module RAMP protein Cmr4 [Nonomuraea sp. NPDC049419]|uniref:type III-B CRISPR module RAMP protein Cmr4 n=1 Tax=Nonomuraea sp. NPDC049419 TaxID=3155772 RepID=UPI003415FB35
MLFLYAETPVHAGADTGSGVIGLPIQREVATGLPIIKGESLKGALREHFRGEPARIEMFGSDPPTSGGETSPGAVRVHEAQLVAFPAPTTEGTFTWVTSPLAQARLGRKIGLAGLSLPDPPKASDASCLVTRERAADLVVGPYVVGTQRSEELRAWAEQVAEHALPDQKYFREKFARDMINGGDELLAGVSRECAPVVARIQLNGAAEQPTKTVNSGPFYSEYLPGESLLAALVEGSRDHLDVLAKLLDGKVLRVGGDESIGKGLMWCRLWRNDVAPAI